MRTDELLEHWNTDPSAVVAAAVEMVGPCDVYLGGSLADDLGSVNSDVDLYCFRADEAGITPFPVVTTSGDANLELHVVGVGPALLDGSSLRGLITETEPPAPHRWPLLSPQRFRQMHALYRDRALQAGEVSEAARRAFAPDLLHVYAALRATLSAGTLTEDLLMFSGPEHTYTRLYTARLVAESAIDAALASRELVNPNPKWRLLLARRARFDDGQFPEPGRLLGALFPDISDSEQAIALCLRVAAECLGLVTADGVLRRFPSVRDCAHLVESAVSDYAAAAEPGP